MRPAPTAVTTPLDVAVAVVLAAAATVETLGRGGDRAGLRAAFAAGTVLALVFRRRLPVAMSLGFAGGMALESFLTESPDEMAVLIGCVIASFSVAGYSRRREGALGVGLISLAVAAAISVDPSDDLSNIAPTLVLFVWVPAAVGFAFAARGHKLRSLALRAETAERETEQALDAERQRVARELHDVVSHAVTVIAVQAAAGRATLASDAAATARSLDAIAESSRDALAELHSLLGLLREPAEPPTLRGVGDLTSLVDTVRSAGVDVDLDARCAPLHLTASASHVLYRVVQEGLTNALRHVRSPRLRVSLRSEAGLAVVEVVSTGRRHQSSYGGSGSGLAGIRERLAAVGGSLETSVADDTFRLCASVPDGAGHHA